MEVSIIVPTYNRPFELKKALESIRTQKSIDISKEIEVLVVNDGGVDVSDIIKSEKNLGLNIKYLKHDQCRKLPCARNTGIDNAKGDFISFLDDDDIFLPNHLNTLLCKIKSNENIDVVVSSCYVSNYRINNVNSIRCEELWDIDIYPLLLDVTNLFPIHTALFKNFSGTKARFDTSLSVIEDWDMWLRLMREYDYKFVHIKDVTAVYHRLDDNSMIGNAVKDFSNLVYLGETIRNLWRKWPSRDLKTDKFRFYMANMNWLALSCIGQGKLINPNFYLRTIREIQKVWTGEKEESKLIDNIEFAVKEDPK